MDFRTIEPELARGIVEKITGYGASLGFPPPAAHQDWMRIWGNTTAADVDHLVTCGREGKPCFMSSPTMSAEQQLRIIHRLNEQLGTGNFDYMMTDSPREPLANLIRVDAAESTDDFVEDSDSEEFEDEDNLIQSQDQVIDATNWKTASSERTE